MWGAPLEKRFAISLVTSPLADQTSRIVAELERSECGELHLFTLVIFMKVTFHHIVDACVEFCFLNKEFLNLTIKCNYYTSLLL